MTEPIRLLHFADLHIGVESYGSTDPTTGISSRALDFIHRLDELVAYAAAHDVDLIICAGDIFHSRIPTPTYQREFAWRLLDMARLCPVILLEGNHDMPTMLKKATSIEIFDTLEVANVTVGNAYEVHRVETRRGPVQVATAPYPHKARLLEDESTRGMSIGEIDALLQQQVSLIIGAMAKEVNQDEAPRVLAGHFSVSGALLGSERKIMLGRDAVVLPSTLTDPAWDYVALGHIHMHQNLTQGQAGKPPVVYSGSIERIDFGEEHDKKGFCWVELARGATTWNFVTVDARPFQTVRVDVRESINPTAEVISRVEAADLKGKVVRLIIQITPANDPLLHMREIRAALRAAAHHIAAIQKQIERPQRTAWQGDASPESLSPMQLLENYLITQETPEARRRVLLEHAERLFRSSD
ncbi:MAG: exonuclease SbcCD subunit D [Anaerolineae bacterium]|nr:exonuclease SbcCD subunit D [Anaerolineae bacterium]